MTDDQFRDLTISTEEEFRDALASVVERARGSDITVQGAWEVPSHDTAHDWDIMITKLARERADTDLDD